MIMLEPWIARSPGDQAFEGHKSLKKGEGDKDSDNVCVWNSDAADCTVGKFNSTYLENDEIIVE